MSKSNLEGKVDTINSTFAKGAGFDINTLSTMIMGAVLVGIVVWALYSIVNIVRGDEDAGLKINHMLWVFVFMLVFISAISFL